jgi:hypothetical protein
MPAEQLGLWAHHHQGYIRLYVSVVEGFEYTRCGQFPIIELCLACGLGVSEKAGTPGMFCRVRNVGMSDLKEVAV